MSADAAARLRDDAGAALRPLAVPVRALSAAQIELRADDGDFLDACQATLRAVLAAEAAEDAAKAAKEALRRLLTDALEMGPGVIRTATHTASTGRAKRAVIITGDVPPEWLLPPKPDKGRIGAALDAGEALPFATRSNGAEPVLTIRARKD